MAISRSWSVVATALFVVVSAAALNGTVDVADRYIVVLKQNVNITNHLSFVEGAHDRSADRYPFAGLDHKVAIGNWQAYAGHFKAPFVIQLESHPDVAYIEPDGVLRAASIQHQQDPKEHISGRATQHDATIALNIISHRKRNGFDYVYDSSAGSQTFAYIVDTGIDTSHEQFEGRAREGYVGKGLVRGDEDGHGTHVAGLIGGRTFGVAKKSYMVSVKVMGSEGACTARALLAGYEWAYNDIVRYGRATKSVINVSVVGVSARRAIGDAIDEAAKAGVTTVVAAGNSGSDEPWQQWTAKSAIVVGATDLFYKKASFSNYGDGISLFAPGIVQSSWIGRKNPFKTKSGTSQAAALVSGVVVLLKGQRSLRGASVTKRVIMQLATRGPIKDPKGSPNLLLYNGSGM
ncbi:subtilisin-like protein [Myriangium duriaei CBS 260.36]|uniref:Subtilisin-like protein n=1 Tax=Myriangium duriaei CBS 260.36 TaxID=1168546 RepID=A0A9P4MH48_9PEZI|nr:subtilisin-like protein [Myriangium duriaei CBS 260.36]